MPCRIGDIALKMFEMSDWLEVTSLTVEGADGIVNVPSPCEPTTVIPEPVGPFRIVVEVAAGFPPVAEDQIRLFV